MCTGHTRAVMKKFNQDNHPYGKLVGVEPGVRLSAGSDTTVLAFDHTTRSLGYRTDPIYVQPKTQDAIVTFLRFSSVECLVVLKCGDSARVPDVDTMSFVAKEALGVIEGPVFAGLANFANQAGVTAFRYKDGTVFVDDVTDYGRVVGNNLPLTFAKRQLDGFKVLDDAGWAPVVMDEETRRAISGKQYISRVDDCEHWSQCVMFTSESGEASIVKLAKLATGEIVGAVEVEGIKFPGLYIGQVANPIRVGAYAIMGVKEGKEGVVTTTMRLEPVGNVRQTIASAVRLGKARHHRLNNHFVAHPGLSLHVAR